MPQLALADISGPFYDPAKPFRNWSSFPYYQTDTASAPFVDARQLAWGVDRAIAQLSELAAQGYTGIVLDNLAHLTSFDAAPVRIEDPQSPQRLRALAYAAAFAPLFAAAAAAGMDVFVTTDMQWSTPAVRRYVGELTPDNQRLREVNAWALAELFARFPQVKGVFVRVGEAGGAHDLDGYSGHMIYRTAAELRGLITGLLPVCEEHDRLLVVRTWSIGIGELGDLLHSPARYRAVFGGLTSPHLLVSIKHVPSDFFRHMPANPTLNLPGPRQIVELQNRREYDLFGMVPSGIGALHQSVFAAAQQQPQVAGFWAWNATGGWGGGTAALGTDGWSVWTRISSALTAALAQNPALDTRAFVADWCRTQLSGSPAFVQAVADLYVESERIIASGWYHGPLRDEGATLGGVRLPPLLWVWWTRPTAAPLVWATLIARLPDPLAALRATETAAARAAYHADTLAALAPADPAGQQIVLSAIYLRDAITAALTIRRTMVPALLAAQVNHYDKWSAAAGTAFGAVRALEVLRDRWAGRTDYPPLELDEVLGYLRLLGNAPRALWAQARAASAIVARVQSHGLPGRNAKIAGLAFGAGALLLLTNGRYRTALGALLISWFAARNLGGPAATAALPWLNERLYLLPSIFFEAGPALTEWAD